MAHLLRKYTSNRGSALFMVISTMTALIISCMAMYFSMVSARSSQYAVFNQMQANQSAQSIADIVYNSIMDPSNHGKGGGVLFDEMKKLAIGETLTTDANDFISLDPGNSALSKADDPNIGAYSVTITRLADVNGDKQFDIMVLASVEGSRDAIHLVLGYNENMTGEPVEGEDGSGGDAELFAATGYLPNDAYIDGGYYLVDVFYDTQYTYMNTFGGSGENRIGQNLSTGGDLMLGNNAMSVVHSASSDAIAEEDVNKIGPVTWAIRGNFYPNLSSDMGVRGGSQFLVGGDLISTSGNNFFYIKNGNYKGAVQDHISVYVNGDFYYSGADIKTNTWVFVNGNVYNVGNNAQGNAKIFVTGATPAERAAKIKCTTNTPVYEWPLDGPFASGLSYNEAMKLLGQKTATIAYYKWDISSNTTGAEEIDIRINASNSSWNYDGKTYDAYAATYVIAAPGSSSEDLVKSGKELGVVGNKFVVKSVATNGGQDMGSTILIDTGEDPNNIMTIKLSDVTGNKQFSWFLDPSTKRPPTGAPNNNVRAILVKGRGTVLIDIPKGITYMDAGFQFTGHIGWFLIEGGREAYNNGHITFTGVDPRGKYSARIVKYIHKTCAPGDGCVYEPDKESTAKCIGCGNPLTQVECKTHGVVNKYCATCFPEKKDRTDWCVNRFDKAEFDKFYLTLSDENKKLVTDSEGKTIYPTTNFMYVSCDEGADMRFTRLPFKQQWNPNEYENATYNTLFGFIYAPYMTYSAAGGEQGGGLLKLVGGMTVSDYDILAINGYIGCYPDKMPNELAGMEGGGSMAGGKLTGVTKSWKFEIGGYR